jgi:two-component system, NtrC family, phosphoglycerate transport system response regulator PgtA
VVSEKSTILIVDDENDLLDLYRQSLEMFDVNVLCASDGVMAWSMFKKNIKSINLVISDIFMPQMNGVELLDKIKTADSKLPVILITGYGHLKTLVEESSFAPDGYLEKPFSLPDLFKVVSNFLPAVHDIPI